MKHRYTRLLGLLFLCVSISAFADIKNIRAQQQEGQLVVSYDLDEAKPANVSALIAVEDRIYSPRGLSITGDIGNEVAPGKARKFTWNILGDFPRGLAATALISIQLEAKLGNETNLARLSDVQSEIYRRLDAEKIDLALANGSVEFSDQSAELVNTSERLLAGQHYREVDQVDLDKARYYCARTLEDQRALKPAAGKPAMDAFWQSLKTATPVINAGNQARYLNCLLASVGPHNAFLSAEEYKELQVGTQGVFGGLGMEVGIEGDHVKVVTPLEDSPAFQVGIKAGDRILKIDQTSTSGLSLLQAVRLMRGKLDTQVTLTLSRPGQAEPLVLTLTRATIKIQSVKHRMLDPGTGYIRINQFQERTGQSLVEALNALEKANAGALRYLVLDLRNNPGGLLNAAVAVAGAFLGKNDLVVTTNGRSDGSRLRLSNAPEHYLRATGEPDYLKNLPAWVKTVPMAVLVNAGSASAAEIVAGALQDHQRALVVGPNTFGKGTVQTVLPATGGAALKLTTALYYTPNGRAIQRSGIGPDVLFEQDAASNEEAAAFAERLLATPGIMDSASRGAVVEKVKIAEFFTLYKNAVRSPISVFPQGVAEVPAPLPIQAPVAVVEPEPPAIREPRLALVIGNAAYRESPLRNPVNDAGAIAAKLRSLGFEVIEKHNLTQKQIGRTLSEFRSRLVPGGTALFYYAGHGLQVGGVNYLPAVDADIASEEDVPTQAIDLNKVLSVMEGGKTRVNLVYLDACRNNPYSRSFRSAGEGLARVNAPSGTLIFYATRPGSVAADGDGQNGLYTQNLLTAMEIPGLTVEQVQKRVATGVRVGSRGRQEPWMEGLLEGDFYFRAGAASPVAAPGRPATGRPAR